MVRVRVNALLWYMFSSPAPTGSPATPSVVTVTSEMFVLSWEQPAFEETNGIIRHYVIQVTEVETGDSYTVTSNTTRVTLHGLHPFYTYICTVAAETIGIGPYSIEIVVQLAEERKPMQYC